MKTFKRMLGLVFAWSIFTWSAMAELAPHRVTVTLNQTSRPNLESPRSEDELYDYQVFHHVKLVNLTEPSGVIKIQSVIIYDDIATTGKIKRLNFSQVENLGMEKQEERTLDTRPFRLTGKVTKTGQQFGLKYVGYAVQVWEGEKLILEDIKPSPLKREGTDLLAVLNGKSQEKEVPVVTKTEVKKPVEPQKTMKTEEAVASSPEKPHQDSVVSNAPAKGEIRLFDFPFTPEDAGKILDAVNRLSEEELMSVVGLTRQAAHNLVLKRPFKSLEELPKVSYVKKQAMGAFKEYVLTGPKKPSGKK